MKVLTFISLALVLGQCSAYLIRVPTKPTQPKIATVAWVHIQKLMLPLFENICEESTNEIVIRLAQEFSLDTITGAYTKPDVVDNLRNLKTSKSLLPKGEIFTEYNSSHMNEFKILYEFFYYAKDFDTFYKGACWARQNVNCGVFVDAIYLAVLNRRDTSKISIPAPYELIPNYFIPKDVIFKASSLLLGEDLTAVDDVRVENNEYILDANYTTELNDDTEDSKLAYFREDIGLNSYYFLRKLRNAPWFHTPSNVNNNYGEYMFMMMKQFASRYDLERYSNGLPELESFDWDSVVSAYNPMLTYSNGNEFGHRTSSGPLGNSDEVTFLKTIENNLATVVGHLRQAGHNKTQIMNHIIEILVTSDRNYESIARRLLGYDLEANESQYSTLEHYMTSMRNPIFWKINKKIVELIDNALKMLPSYSRAELYFPGVEVLNIETKKMMTSFENFQFDVTDSLRTIDRNTTFRVKIGQMRLDHKPFTMKLNVSSMVTQKGLIKIFLGPRTLPGELALKKNSFVLMDNFEFSLKRGINIISRSSEEMKSFSNDFMSLDAIRKKVEDSEFGLDALPLVDVESQVGYPSRLVLPKGLPEGLPCQLFVFVAPFTKNNIGGSYLVANTDYNTVILSPGYPLDLIIEEKQFFNLPNVLVKDITITHKGEAKTSEYGGKTGPKKWNSNNSYDSTRFDYSTKYENNYYSQDREANKENIDYILDEAHNLLGERPRFTFKNKENKDYSVKSNQYKYINNNTSKQNYKRKDNVKEKDIDFEQNSSSSFDKESPKTETGINYDMSLMNEPMIDSSIHTIDNLIDRPYEKIHGVLGARPDFTYKKDKTDYSAKKNQYKDKNEQYTKKRMDYSNSDIELLNLSGETEKQTDFKNKNYTKYIIIDDKNNMVVKNVTENKNVNSYKSNIEKFDKITKEIIENPVAKKNDIIVKETMGYPVEDDLVLITDDSVEESEDPKIYDPVYIQETPRKRVTVYDFLFNNNFDDEKLYE